MSDKRELEIVLSSLDGDFKDLIVTTHEYFTDIFNGHSEFQIVNFVLNDKDFPLPDDKYYQAKKEAYVRYEGLVNLCFRLRRIESELKLVQLDIEELDAKLGYADQGMNTIEYKRTEIQTDIKKDAILKLEYERENIKKQAENILREINIFIREVERNKEIKEFNSYDEKEEASWNIKMQGRPEIASMVRKQIRG